jgi:hypothetical protein
MVAFVSMILVTLPLTLLSYTSDISNFNVEDLVLASLQQGLNLYFEGYEDYLVLTLLFVFFSNVVCMCRSTMCWNG